MKDLFGQAQEVQQGFLQNPFSLAGLMMGRGHGNLSFKDAITSAASTIREQEQGRINAAEAQRRQQEAMRAQEIQGKLAQSLRANPNIDPNELAALLAESGQNLPVGLVESLIPGRAKRETFTGPDGRRYEQFIDPNTNQLRAEPIPGQETKPQPKVTSSEARINALKLKDLTSDARTSQTELRILDDLDKAFKELDESTGSHTESGSLISKLTPEAYPNLAYNKKAQAAIEKIGKLNSQLFQNRIRGAGARATDAFKKEVQKGLPRFDITKEARNDILTTKKRENLEAAARSKFFTQWYQKNGKDISGAEDAFISFIERAPLLNENNSINRNILEEIPKIVDQFLIEQPNTGEPVSFEEEQNISRDVMEQPIGDEEEINLEDLSLDELLAARKRKLGNKK